MDETYSSLDKILEISQRFDDEYLHNNISMATELNNTINTNISSFPDNGSMSKYLNDLAGINSQLLELVQNGGDGTDCISANKCVILFHSPACIYCRNFAPTWKKIKKHYKGNEDINIYSADINNKKGKALLISLRERNIKISSVPSMVLLEKIDDNMSNVIKYTHRLTPDSRDDVIAFIDD